MTDVDRIIARLRELALASPSALALGTPPDSRRELLEAFADDVSNALSEAQAQAGELLASLREGPGPWAFASAEPRARRAAVTEHRDRWVSKFTEGARAAHDLARLLSAAAPLVDVLAAADAAVGA